MRGFLPLRVGGGGSFLCRNGGSGIALIGMYVWLMVPDRAQSIHEHPPPTG